MGNCTHSALVGDTRVAACGTTQSSRKRGRDWGVDRQHPVCTWAYPWAIHLVKASAALAVVRHPGAHMNACIQRGVSIMGPSEGVS